MKIEIDGKPVGGVLFGEVRVVRDEDQISRVAEEYRKFESYSITVKLSPDEARSLWLLVARCYCVHVAETIAMGAWAVACAERIVRGEG